MILGYQASYSEIFLVIFFKVFFFSIRPTDPISGNAFDVKRKISDDNLRQYLISLESTRQCNFAACTLFSIISAILLTKYSFHKLFTTFAACCMGPYKTLQSLAFGSKL